MRSQNVKDSYVKAGWHDDSKVLEIGNQMSYEWEQDLIAMKWALQRITEFLEVAREKKYFTGTLEIAQRELLNRISEYSCPSNLKKEYRTVENCPLKQKCKCCISLNPKP